MLFLHKSIFIYQLQNLSRVHRKCTEQVLFKEHPLFNSQDFSIFESNTTSDWLNYTVTSKFAKLGEKTKNVTENGW